MLTYAYFLKSRSFCHQDFLNELPIILRAIAATAKTILLYILAYVLYVLGSNLIVTKNVFVATCQ